LEGLLAVVGLEVTTKGIRTGTGTLYGLRRDRGIEFQILVDATLKLREPKANNPITDVLNA